MKEKPLLFALQLCPLDAQAGWGLLRLIADVCPESKYAGVDLLVSVRLDTELDMQAVAYAGRRFGRTFTFRTEKLDKGWPAGCNLLATQTYHYFAKQVATGRWNHSGIFMAEADALPMSRDWLARIIEEWRSTNKLVLGFYDMRADGRDHVNGNCIISAQMAKLYQKFPQSPRDLAWDWQWRKEMTANCQPSRLIFNDYRLGMPENPLPSEEHLFETRKSLALPGEILQPAYLHGFKNWQRGQQLVRERLLNASLTAPAV